MLKVKHTSSLCCLKRYMLALVACSLGSSADDTDAAELTTTPAPSNTPQPFPSPLPISYSQEGTMRDN